MSKQKFKHSSLTHFMRRNCDPKMVIHILTSCDVSPRVGCLPPQLVPLVRPENRAYVTDEFGKCLEQFFIDNKKNFVDLDSDITFSAPDISALFNTECVILARGVNIMGVSPWSGGFGVVCKLSFPAIHTDYALKYFLKSSFRNGHGAHFEIPTAFAANHAEPCNNCPVYMASLKPGREFMLSLWGGDKIDGMVRENKHVLYSSSDEEDEERNYRAGRRIDYGETYQTDYGRMPYRVRKMFRKVLHAANMGYDCEIEYMYHDARNNRDMRNLDRAVKLAWFTTFMNDQYSAMNVIERCMKSQER
ncbi:MAG: hypothetical protein K2M34_01695 [Alphaproteobacteria bacterium]|nr:hypothetical protein [Alphaproteobacteria bacterium]